MRRLTATLRRPPWHRSSDDGGAHDAIAAALGALDGRSPFTEQATRLRDVLAELDDVVGEIRAAGERIDESPERLAEIRERRQVLKNLRRKYGDDLAAVMAFHAESADRLAELERFDERAAELDRARQEALAAELVAAEAVGRRRREVGPLLAVGGRDRTAQAGDAARVGRRRDR